MNIIDTSITLNPATMKLVHCKGCDTTWVDKKIPNVCPYCGAERIKGKNNPLAKASEDECESFMEEYGEAMANGADSSDDSGSYEEEFAETVDNDNSGNYDDYSSVDDSISQDTGSYDISMDTESYEPIGYDPDELANSMNGKKKIGKMAQKQLISDAEKKIKEAKWAVQRAGLPTDGFQIILPDVKNKADSLGGYIPLYTSFLLKMTVDNTLQRELRHPRKGRRYDISDVNEMLEELDINENYWESYYSVAGLSY